MEFREQLMAWVIVWGCNRNHLPLLGHLPCLALSMQSFSLSKANSFGVGCLEAALKVSSITVDAGDHSPLVRGLAFLCEVLGQRHEAGALPPAHCHVLRPVTQAR